VIRTFGQRESCSRPVVTLFGGKKILFVGIGRKLPVGGFRGVFERQILPAGLLGDFFVFLAGADEDVPVSVELLGDVFETFGDAARARKEVLSHPVFSGEVRDDVGRFLAHDADVLRPLAGVDEQAHVATSVEELVYYVYIDTETNTLYGTDLRMEVTQGEGSALITTETIFSEFDDADEVTIPDVAIEETE